MLAQLIQSGNTSGLSVPGTAADGPDSLDGACPGGESRLHDDIIQRAGLSVGSRSADGLGDDLMHFGEEWRV